MRPRIPHGLAAAVTAAAWSLAGCAGAPPEPPEDALASCSLGEVRSWRLTDGDGLQWYVEARAVAPDPSGQVLVVGLPSYTWAETPEGMEQRATNPRPGVLLEGPATRPIEPTPHPELAVETRAVALGGGRWGVWYGTGGDPFARAPFDTLWYGVVEGGRWTRREAIPAPPGRRFSADAATTPLLTALGPALTVSLDWRGGGPGLEFVWRGPEGWRSETVTRRALEGMELLPGPGGPPWILAMGPSTGDDAPRDLVLFERGEGWVERARLPFRSGDPAGPLTARPGVGGASTVSWITRNPDVASLWTLRVPDGDAPLGTPRVIDHGLRFAAPVDRAGPPLWVTVHPDAEGGGGTLRVLTVDGSGRPAILGSLPNPYTGPIDAWSQDAHRLDILGPEFREQAGRASVVSLRLSVDLVCPAPSEQEASR